MHIQLICTQEIACLTVGKIVVIQTKRNNQVAFLKRLPNENEIPAVQVSTVCLEHHNVIFYLDMTIEIKFISYTYTL